MEEESSLSNEVVAKETHEKATAYFRVAEEYGYKFIMEVKDIRDKRYYIALGFDSFDAYCESAWRSKRDFMDQRIQIAESYGNEWDFADTYRQLGHSKSLLLAKLAPEQRQLLATQPQKLNNGLEKTVDEMTVRELREVKKSLKEKEDEIKYLEENKLTMLDAIQSLKDQPERVREVVKEIVPDRIKDELSKLQNEYRKVKDNESALQALIGKTHSEKEELETYISSSEFELLETKRKEEIMKSKTHVSMFDLQLKIQKFINETAPSLYLQGALAYADDYVRKELLESAKSLEYYVLNLIGFMDIKANRNENKNDNRIIIDVE